MMHRKALGKGLDALIPNFELGVPETSEAGTYVLVDEIVANRNQPRTSFDDRKMAELVESIREQGVIQPIVVQKAETGYELIVGERRWRAAKKVGLKKIPAVIKEAGDVQSLEMAIIENIHRQDLNPIEEARAYSRLAGDFGMKQEEIARKVGKNRASVANYLRLLKLSRPLQEDLISGKISMGHARALLALPSDKAIDALRQRIIKEGLSVRQTESMVKKYLPQAKAGRTGKKPTAENRFLKIMETELARALGTQVKIVADHNGGTVKIAYYSDEDLERLCGIFVPKMA